MEEKQDPKKLGKLAAKVIGDQKLLRSLSDKVYKLMLEDLRQQKERSKQ
ncbi:MAG TPA: hypothetical protein VK203_12900 [Nostocaceae cyanobacterium]|nr:hypothetical protein [Nostocaceae cyanobacterium]